jgi:hypothetical protein
VNGPQSTSSQRRVAGQSHGRTSPNSPITYDLLPAGGQRAKLQRGQKILTLKIGIVREYVLNRHDAPIRARPQSTSDAKSLRVGIRRSVAERCGP